MSALDLPSHQRLRLIRALETGMLEAPYAEIAVRTAIGGDVDASGSLWRVGAVVGEGNRRFGSGVRA